MTVKLGIEWEIASTPSDATYNFLDRKNWTVGNDPTIRTIKPEQERTEFKTTTPYTIDLNDIKASEERIIKDFKTLLGTLTNKFIDGSMGIHIHFSGIKKLSCVFDREFFNHVKKEYTKIAVTELEKQRLIDGATYNSWTYTARGERRRSAINYMCAYQRHNTIELRFLPTTKKVSEFRKYIHLVLKLLKDVENKNYPGAVFKIDDNDNNTNNEYKVLI